jgi:hypothetical protein
VLWVEVERAAVERGCEKMRVQWSWNRRWYRATRRNWQAGKGLQGLGLPT